MFGATFNLVITCQITTSFGTLRDGSLEINNLALNNYFSTRNIFQNDVNALSKNGFKKLNFLSKHSKILCNLDHTILFKFH